jgi:hypothetical protein
VTCLPLCRLVKLEALDNSCELEKDSAYLPACLDTVDAVIERYQSSGDLLSATVLLEGMPFSMEGMLPRNNTNITRWLRKSRTLSSVLDDDEKEKVRVSPPLPMSQSFFVGGPASCLICSSSVTWTTTQSCLPQQKLLYSHVVGSLPVNSMSHKLHAQHCRKDGIQQVVAG